MPICFADIAQSLAVWPEIFIVDLLRYLIPASFAFVVLWGLLRHRLSRRKVQAEFPHRRHLWREFRYSLLTVLIFSVNGILVMASIDSGHSMYYAEIADYGWLYWGFSLVAIIVLHDAYFYWTHRMMHHPRLFKFFHRLHHRSHNPSPWAAYALAPAEAAVHAVFLTMTVWVMPLHGSVIYIFLIHMILRNVLGHTGFELFPRGFTRLPLAGILTTVTHHDMHHSNPRGNFALYFTWWDRIIGTEHADYSGNFERVTDCPACRIAKNELTPSPQNGAE